MKKVLLAFTFFIFHLQLFSQVMDYSATFKSALDLYNIGNYNGSKVRFIIAQRKATIEQNYTGKELCISYSAKCDDCAEFTTKGDQAFELGDFESAKKYYDGIYQLNPKDPKNLLRAQKCRNEAEFIIKKRGADDAYTANDWWKAGDLYAECLDSVWKDVSTYRRYEGEMKRRYQDCLNQKSKTDPDSLRMKAKMLTDKFKKKVKQTKEKTEDPKPQEKKNEPAPGKVFLPKEMDTIFLSHLDMEPLINNSKKRVECSI